ncbi:MAG: exodeoxyribonuclease III [Pseudomonadota bacterium]
MPLTIATWNINSVRLRIGLVTDFLAEVAPDILCLQETKSPVEKIPVEDLAAAGYPHLIARGQKGYNGVAIISRMALEDAGQIDWCAKGDARHVAATLPGGAVLHNFYVPAGGDVPDREVNDKFGHKLDFVAEMTEWGGAHAPGILVGDLNIAPLEADVWSHKQLLKVVSHTPVETEAMTRAMEAGGWQDVVRTDLPEPEPVFTWWSYRSPDWAKADKGRRLDHIWARGVSHVAGSSLVLKEWRGRSEKPSDHCPVLASFDL